MTDKEGSKQKSRKTKNEIFWDTCSFISLICLFCIAFKQVIGAFSPSYDLINKVYECLISIGTFVPFIAILAYAVICAIVVWLAVCISRKSKALALGLLILILLSSIGMAFLLLIPAVVISAYIPVLFLLVLVVAVKRLIEVYSSKSAIATCGTEIVSRYVFEILTLAALLCALSTLVT